jgi:hypothetical protein
MCFDHQDSDPIFAQATYNLLILLTSKKLLSLIQSLKYSSALQVLNHLKQKSSNPLAPHFLLSQIKQTTKDTDSDEDLYKSSSDSDSDSADDNTKLIDYSRILREIKIKTK